MGWKRIDAVLRAARNWEVEFGNELLTLIIGKTERRVQYRVAAFK